MKVIRTAAIVVGAVALVATGIGAAVSAGVIGASAFTATAASVASIAGFAGAALAAVSVFAAPKPKNSLGGNPTKFTIDKEAGIPYMIGRTCSGGKVVHRQYHGSKNEYDSFVTVHSLGPIKSLGDILIDGTAQTFSGSAALGTFAGFMWLVTQLGACPEATAMASPVGAIPGWDSTSKLSGLAADLWTLKFDEKNKKYPTGIPDRKRVGEGVYVYDARLDSTYPGGSGACRLGNESTYVWDECPANHALTWAFGRIQNGTLVAGGGMKITGIDVRTFVDWANVCDANGWKAGGIMYTTADTAWDVLKAICQAGGAEPTNVGGNLSVIFSAPKVAIGTITSDDVSGTIDVPSTASMRKRRNSIIPRVRLESHGWEVVPLDPVTIDDYVTIDGAKRPRETSYPLVQDADQAAELATYDILNGRELDPIMLPLKIYALGYLPGDCLTLQLPEANLIDRKVIVRTRQLSAGSLGVTLGCRSETPEKHDFALGRTGTPPPTPDLSVPAIYTDPPGPMEWSLSTASIGTGAAQIPALVVVGAVANPYASTVVFEYRPYVSGQAADANWRGGGSGGPDLVREEIASVTGGVAYEVAVSYRSRGVSSSRRILGPITTPLSGAQIAAAAAQATADSKNAISWGATPPAADDSVEDDRWADASNGYVEYRRLAGSGRIAIGGNRIVIGGAPILIRPWAPAPDSRIGYAVTTADQGVADAAAARARADAANAAATDAIDRLDDLADDGVLSESEKKTVLIPQDARLEGAWTVLDAQAASYGVTTERTAAAAARTAWQTYRNALSPAWNNDTLPTTGINRTVYRQKLLDYETALTTLTKAITQVAKDAASIADAKAVAAQADATSGLAQVAIIRSNGYLDVSEKAAFKRQVTSYSAEYADIVAKATAAGVSSATYATAYSDLISYLATLSPAWDNMSLDTAIVPATFDGKVTDYLFARQQLLNATADAIRAKAATAQTTADSKSKLIVRDTPPLASEQVENDEWVDSANGNRKYSRLAGSGAIAFSGNKLVFGGNGLAIRPYQLRRDFGIDYAQLTAQGAQTTADGKNTVFPPSTTAPTANKIGDLWPNPVTGDVKVWNGTSWVLTSDQTALTQVVVEINPRAVTVAADYLGSLGTGWSHTITPKVNRGGADVRAGSISTYAITTSNLTATVNNTAGSAAKGAVTVTDVATDDGAYYDLVATVDGIAQPAVRVTYSKKRSSPPPAASGTDSKSTDAFNPLIATTATAIIADMSVTLAAGQRLVGTAGLDYYIDGTGSSPVSRTATVKWLYYAGGVWSDFDTAITGSSAFQEWTDAEGNTSQRRPGHGEFNQAKSGLSAGTYPCRLVAYQNASGLTMTFTGFATIEAKP